MNTSIEDTCYFCDRALDGMTGILESLGDELANRRPDIPETNSPFVILTHCLGVMEYWGGQVIAGRTIHRDRPAEFRARGRVSDLVAAVPRAKQALRNDVEGVDPAAPVVNPPNRPFESPRDELTDGVVVLHILEELVQHHGQMEITRDLLRRDAGRP
jgi:hypothetical protein